MRSMSRRRASGLTAKLKAVPGVQTVEESGPGKWRLLAQSDVRADAAAAIVNGGGRLLRVSVEEPSLDVIYNRYFQSTAEGGMRNAA